jgi:transcriptional regulator with XRE-family HTH domain
MPTDQMADPVRDALRRRRAERGVTVSDLARESRLPVSSLHDFLNGRRPLGSVTYRALYRAYPDLRWLLEEYQRRSALETRDAQPAGEPAATGPPRSPGR